MATQDAALRQELGKVGIWGGVWGGVGGITELGVMRVGCSKKLVNVSAHQATQHKALRQERGGVVGWVEVQSLV